MAKTCGICDQPIYLDENQIWCLTDDAPLELPLAQCFKDGSGYWHEPKED